jgi:hypothetical protein
MKKSDSDKTGTEESVVKKSAPEFFVRSLRASDLGSQVGYMSDPIGLDRYRRFGNDYLARSLRSFGSGEYLARTMREGKKSYNTNSVTHFFHSLLQDV